MDRASHEGIVEQQIIGALASMFPNGAGQANSIRVEHSLRTVAHIAFEQGREYALLSLLTVQDVAGRFGISERRARALIRQRHERFGVGYQVSGTNQWLVTPEELATLEPDVKYRRK